MDDVLNPLIAEDALLVLSNEQGGLVTDQSLEHVVGGALLSELVLAGSITIEGRRRRRRRVRATGPRPTDPLLDAAVTLIPEKERSPERLIAYAETGLGPAFHPRLRQRLEERGVLRTQQLGRGVFSWTTWSVADTTRQAELRRRLHAVLVAGAVPDERATVLAGLAWAIRAAHRVIDHDGSKRALRRRAKELALGDALPQGVRHALVATRRTEPPWWAPF